MSDILAWLGQSSRHDLSQLIIALCGALMLIDAFAYFPAEPEYKKFESANSTYASVTFMAAIITLYMSMKEYIYRSDICVFLALGVGFAIFGAARRRRQNLTLGSKANRTASQ